MHLDVRYKDVTFEALNENEFLKLVKPAFPRIGWEKPFEAIRAAGEK